MNEERSGAPRGEYDPRTDIYRFKYKSRHVRIILMSRPSSLLRWGARAQAAVRGGRRPHPHRHRALSPGPDFAPPVLGGAGERWRGDAQTWNWAFEDWSLLPFGVRDGVGARVGQHPSPLCDRDH